MTPIAHLLSQKLLLRPWTIQILTRARANFAFLQPCYKIWFIIIYTWYLFLNKRFVHKWNIFKFSWTCVQEQDEDSDLRSGIEEIVIHSIDIFPRFKAFINLPTNVTILSDTPLYPEVPDKFLILTHCLIAITQIYKSIILIPLNNLHMSKSLLIFYTIIDLKVTKEFAHNLILEQKYHVPTSSTSYIAINHSLNYNDHQSD